MRLGIDLNNVFALPLQTSDEITPVPVGLEYFFQKDFATADRRRERRPQFAPGTWQTELQGYCCCHWNGVVWIHQEYLHKSIPTGIIYEIQTLELKCAIFEPW